MLSVVKNQPPTGLQLREAPGLEARLEQLIDPLFEGARPLIVDRAEGALDLAEP